jgi:hypothetical protein
LIVREVDARWDSVVHPLLNRDLARQGAKRLVKLGNELVDVSTSFRIALQAYFLMQGAL